MRNGKTAIKLFITFNLNLLLFQPLNITNILLTFGINVGKSTHFTLLVLAHSHVVINPFLYALNLKDFKKASQKILKKDENDLSTSN